MMQEEKLLLLKTVKQINHAVKNDVTIMEICGTHTHQIARLGLRKLLSPKIHLVSGPGCPVCVTECSYIDTLLVLLKQENVIVATFGDLLRVQGSCESLEEQQAICRRVVTVYSPEEVLALARKRPNNNIVFAAVGFETTAPLYAALIQTADKEGIQNLSLLTSIKRMEPVIRYLFDVEKIHVDGILCPGHVAAVTGAAPFLPITYEYKIPAVICGFEAIDLISSICLLCEQITGEQPLQFINAYQKCVRNKGNPMALTRMNQVFTLCDAHWRGIGSIPKSGLVLRGKYRAFDSLHRFKPCIETNSNAFQDICACGSILTGKKTPNQCKIFGNRCTPEHPVGPCMVSSEGACAAYYRYGGNCK